MRHNRGVTITGFDSKLVVLRKCKIISLFNVVDSTLDLDVK